jgi:ferredoxin
MKVVANLALCQGHARCAAVCPQVFGTDAQFGKVVVLLDPVPAELQEQARLAVHNCPEGALRVSKDSRSFP